MAERKSKRPFFGRKKELAYLRERAESKGLTAVVGRPQAGKSWLFEEFHDHLAEDKSFLVGYAESTGEYADLLLRSLSKLYKRWLSNSSFLKQAVSLWKRHKSTLITKVGGTVGSGLGKYLEMTNPPAKGVSKVIDEWFKSLHKADTDLRAGGVFLPVLSYDKARDLLLVLDVLSGGETRAVLILDALDRSLGAEVEANTLQMYLQHLEDWPECHIFLVTRSPDAKNKKQEEVALRCCHELDEASVAAAIWEIPDWDVGYDDDEASALLFYLNDKVPATKDVANARLIEMIGGVPGVIGAWLKAQSISTIAPENEADLKRLAADAHKNSHHEIGPILSSLRETNTNGFKAAVRLALLPEMTSQRGFDAYRPVLEAGRCDFPLAELQGTGLLEQAGDRGGDAEIPTFGHTTRYQSVRMLLCTNTAFKPFAREQARILMIELATRIPNVSPDVKPYAVALVLIGFYTDGLDLPSTYLGLSEAASTVVGYRETAIPRNRIQIAAALSTTHPGVSALVSMGLFNTLLDAIEQNDLVRREAILEKLGGLACKRLDDPTVQKALAMGLLNTLNKAIVDNDPSRRNARLNELRKLGRDRHDVIAVQESLGMGLYNMINDARKKNDRIRFDELLKELFELRIHHPDLPAMKKTFDDIDGMLGINSNRLVGEP